MRDGRKTQTRRIAKVRSVIETGLLPPCPYGIRGDTLWVRETFARNVLGCEQQGGLSYRADHVDPKGDGPANPMRWTPAIFMRRIESRLILEIENTRVDRLHSLTERDALAEGVGGVGEFAELWDQINDSRAPWSTNPWVWCVEFRLT